MTAPTDVSATAPEFDSTLQHVVTTVGEGNGQSLVFAGGSVAARQQALARLKEASGYSLHQVGLDTLFDERERVAQGNIREVFDSAGEIPSILCFDNADAFFRNEARQDVIEDRDADEITPRTYLFDRVKAFKGIVVICLSSAAYVAEAEPLVDVVVRF